MLITSPLLYESTFGGRFKNEMNTPSDVILPVLGFILLFAGNVVYWTSLKTTFGAVFCFTGVAGTKLVLDYTAYEFPHAWIPILIYTIVAVLMFVLGFKVSELVHNLGVFLIGIAVGVLGFITIYTHTGGIIEKQFPDVSGDIIWSFGIPFSGLIAGFIAVWLSGLFTIIGCLVAGYCLVQDLPVFLEKELLLIPLVLLGCLSQVSLLGLSRKKWNEQIEDDEEE